MAPDQPLYTNWANHPLMSAKMRISLVSWIVSAETDLTVSGASPPGISHWLLYQLTNPPSKPLKEASLKHLTFKTVFLLALHSGKCRSEIQGTSDMSETGVRCLFTPFSAFFPRTSRPKRVQTVWSHWLSQAWPRFWISP